MTVWSVGVDDRVLHIFASQEAAEDWLDRAPDGGETRRQFAKQIFGVQFTIREWPVHGWTAS